jgi:hypothetical protein
MNILGVLTTIHVLLLLQVDRLQYSVCSWRRGVRWCHYSNFWTFGRSPSLQKVRPKRSLPSILHNNTRTLLKYPKCRMLNDCFPFKQVRWPAHSPAGINTITGKTLPLIGGDSSRLSPGYLRAKVFLPVVRVCVCLFLTLGCISSTLETFPPPLRCDIRFFSSSCLVFGVWCLLFA